MSSFVKKGDRVLEPACGPANLAEFLPIGSHYIGFDANEDFIRYALKKKRDVYVGNVLDKKNYHTCDVVITCDILHHLKPSDRQTFICNCFASAKRFLIICEPVEKEQKTNSLFYPIKKYLTEWSERDGTSNVKMHYFFSCSQLTTQIKNGFGAIPSSVKREVKEIGDDIIGVFIKTVRLGS